MDTITIFCAIDDFYKEFEPRWEQRLTESSLKRRRRRGALCLSEVMTIMVGFHLSGYWTFKHYYLNHVLR
ncbi:hypothetical protein SAMN05421863_104034 [Nitrosomonas communis]|jgi:hypothetical protein|uniref:Transposase DDE domain-containing protein n=1 Tax=Nitrosomonas communis TaxID=44574 RepID=A0A1I4SGM7_9PROT|nr:hypothetical protein SAMN05421863_104034 [Nitrosomonas communis]